MPSGRDIDLTDGRVVRVHESGADGADRPALLWHHGSPQTGALLPPLLEATAKRGLRLLSYGRPSYGGSSPKPGRDIASAASDVAQILDALEIDRCATMGASGGGPHALACAALLPERITGVVSLAGLAPFDGSRDWFDGMAFPGALQAAARGRDARGRFAETDEFDASVFTAADWRTLEGAWGSLGEDAQRAGVAGNDGLIDDDVAYVTPWGFDLREIDAPVLLLQGGEDRMVPPSHAYRLLDGCPSAELWLRPRDGHLSILDAVPVALDWLGA